MPQIRFPLGDLRASIHLLLRFTSHCPLLLLLFNSSSALLLMTALAKLCRLRSCILESRYPLLRQSFIRPGRLKDNLDHALALLLVSFLIRCSARDARLGPKHKFTRIGNLASELFGCYVVGMSSAFYLSSATDRLYRLSPSSSSSLTS